MTVKTKQQEKQINGVYCPTCLNGELQEEVAERKATCKSCEKTYRVLGKNTVTPLS